MSTIEAQWATESMDWGEVEAKHAQMHYLRRSAIIGARAVMDHVGLEEVHPKDRVVEPATLRDYQWRQSKLILLDSSQSDEENPHYARIQEAHRSCAASNGPLQEGLRGRLSHIGKRPVTVESQPSYDRTRFVIVKFGQGDVNNTNVIPMMDRTQLDVRPNLQWTPDAMTSYYQSQINRIAAFIGGVDELAQITQTYIYSRHIGEDLEDRQAEA